MMSLRLPPGALRIVCLSAHPDDVEIGCGGTLLQLGARRELDVDYVVLTGTRDRQAEAESAIGQILPEASVHRHLHTLPDGHLPAHWAEVKDSLEAVATSRQQLAPDLILSPRVDDAHQDHRLVAEMASTVWRNSLILHYEIPKWDGDLGRVTHYVAIDEDVAAQKIRILNDSFTSQRARDWWGDDTFRSMMRIRGIESRSRYAEAFYVDKVNLDISGD